MLVGEYSDHATESIDETLMGSTEVVSVITTTICPRREFCISVKQRVGCPPFQPTGFGSSSAVMPLFSLHRKFLQWARAVSEIFGSSRRGVGERWRP